MGSVMKFPRQEKIENALHTWTIDIAHISYILPYIARLCGKLKLPNELRCGQRQGLPTNFKANEKVLEMKCTRGH